ncbi:LysR family transcriptional regulator [Paenibacillus sp. GD4]|uniref:LysR family transcriptional regulator n=1 Tax=Paenibacillus sp. GD4 TaxID=3068890 RepID=UPI002796D9CA|nr:LysR family transcriptional regulator [Paenibacillus sp. GD4]MDQ1909857.1 LysR family transcriptional regulator [Paenibacillus sp. GD4]
MQIDWLESFVQAVQARSLSKAAEKLHLSQPALSKQMARLEEYLGVKLLHRTPAGIEATEAGEKLLLKAHRILAELRELEAELQVYRECEQYTVGALPSLALHYLPPKVLGLRHKQMQLDIRVYPTSSALLKALQQGSLDCALLESKYTQPPIWAAPLLTEPYLVVLPQGHSLSGTASPLKLGNLRSEPLVVHPADCDVRQTIAAAYQLQRMTPVITAELSFGESLLSYVAAGAGCAILPESAAAAASGLGLCARPIVDFGFERSISLAASGEKLAKRLLRKLQSV